MGRVAIRVLPINAGTAAVGADKLPVMTEYVCPIQLVVERLKAIGWFLPGLGIQRLTRLEDIICATQF